MQCVHFGARTLQMTSCCRSICAIDQAASKVSSILNRVMTLLDSPHLLSCVLPMVSLDVVVMHNYGGHRGFLKNLSEPDHDDADLAIPC